MMRATAEEIGSRARKRFPMLLARRLCGRDTSLALGLDGQVSLFARAAFAFGMAAARTVDTLARLLYPRLSIAGLGARILGRRLALRFVADAARPPALSEALLRQVDAALRDWDANPAASGWVNAIERRFRRQRTRHSGREEAAC
jgi:hypothetical protein